MGSRTIYVPDIGYDTPDYDKAKAWLEDNGIDPCRVLLDSEMVVTDDSITFTGIVRAVNGAAVIAPDGEHVVRETVTLPKVSDPESFGI